MVPGKEHYPIMSSNDDDRSTPAEEHDASMFGRSQRPDNSKSNTPRQRARRMKRKAEKAARRQSRGKR